LFVVNRYDSSVAFMEFVFRVTSRAHVMVCLGAQRCSRTVPDRGDTKARNGGPASPELAGPEGQVPSPAFQEASHPSFCALARSSSTFRLLPQHSGSHERNRVPRCCSRGDRILF